MVCDGDADELRVSVTAVGALVEFAFELRDVPVFEFGCLEDVEAVVDVEEYDDESVVRDAVEEAYVDH